MEQHNTTAIVAEKNGKYLLIKRGHRPEKGFWAVPGGHVDPGESPAEAAQREAKEEVGKIKTEEEPFFVFIHDVKIKHRHKCHTFRGRQTGELRPATDAEELGWFSLDELQKKERRGEVEITHYTKKIFNWLVENGEIEGNGKG